jgi:small redox-active disulfide protein 2
VKKIQILGPGCPNCSKLAGLVDDVAREMGGEYELEKVTDIMKITELGILATPGLVVDGKVLVSGRVPSREELEELLS